MSRSADRHHPGRFWSIHELDVLSNTKGQITEGKATAKLPVVE